MSNEQPTEINNNNRARSAAGLSCDGGDVELTRAPRLAEDGGGKFQRIRTPEHRAKAEAFWRSLNERRRQPGHCSRCGRPHGGETRQCARCLQYQARYRGKMQDRNEKMTAGMVVAMVRQCRREVTKLRETIKKMQREQRNRSQREYLLRRTVRKYADAYPEISKQELAQINHAYDND